MVFSINEQYSILRSLFEVYKTDEENFIPYTPNNGESNNDSDNNSEEDSTEMEDEDTNDEGFTLHQGEIQEIYYYGNIFNSSHEHDYEDISNNGSISFPSIDKKRFYKGVRTCLREYVEEYDETCSYEDMVEVLLGFITEQRFSQGNVEIQISGMTKLLDKKYQFNFTQMKRSLIVEEIIKTAGLVPVIDFTGMLDEVIDYSNNGSGDDEGGDYAGNVSGDVASMAKKVCKGKKTAKAKANAITAFICDHVQYPSPNYSNHQKCPSEVLKSGVSNCCDRARLGYEMASVVKLKARGVHGSNHVWVQYYVDGSWQDSDPGYARRSLGQVYQNQRMNSLWEFPSC